MNKDGLLPQHYQFSIGDLAFTIRKINGLTQVDYSQKLGVVQSTISKVEKNIFDDVPFSLVSKISSEFNIPLNYFQAGILPLKKNRLVKNSIPEHYICNGIYKAKTIFYLLYELEKKYGNKLYKDLKLPKQLLCLNNLNYSLEFINKVYSLTHNHLQEAMKSMPVHGEQECDIQTIYQYLANINGLNIISQQDASLQKIYFTFSNEINELDSIYSDLLKFELQMIFNCTFAIKQPVSKNEYLESPKNSSLYELAIN